jgi:hypothetical protein
MLSIGEELGGEIRQSASHVPSACSRGRKELAILFRFFFLSCNSKIRPRSSAFHDLSSHSLLSFIPSPIFMHFA